MSADPWARPTLSDLRRILESIEPSQESHNREAERIELSVPAEIITARGNTIAELLQKRLAFCDFGAPLVGVHRQQGIQGAGLQPQVVDVEGGSGAPRAAER